MLSLFNVDSFRLLQRKICNSMQSSAQKDAGALRGEVREEEASQSGPDEGDRTRNRRTHAMFRHKSSH